jgi:hypothetical protein
MLRCAVSRAGLATAVLLAVALGETPARRGLFQIAQSS